MDLLDDTSKEDAELMIEDLKKTEGVDDAYYETRDEAMKKFRKRLLKKLL